MKEEAEGGRRAHGEGILKVFRKKRKIRKVSNTEEHIMLNFSLEEST